MLVLARQLNERIVMPTVPAAIEVVAIKPNGIRLGIEAPAEVTILREEILRRGKVSASSLLASAETDAQGQLQRVKQIVRNRLQGVAVGLDLIRRQIQDSGATELQGMLQRMEAEVRRIDEQLHALLSAAPEQASAVAEPESPLPAVSPCLQVEGGLSI